MKRTGSPISSRQPRVALIVETSTSWGRRTIEGVIDYCRHHGPWSLYLEPRGIDEPEKLPSGWTGDGIIARVRTAEFARRLERTGVPVVNVSGIQHPRINFPRVLTDESSVAKLALEHLQSRGFTHFGYCGIAEQRYVAQRAHVFEEVVVAAGFDCHVYLGRAGIRAGHDLSADARDRAEWLKSLPKPVGVSTFSAVQGRRVAEAAALAGLRVPEDVAIITVDTDDLIGELVHPPLSAVQLATERTGFEAAKSLHQLMQGKPAEPVVTLQPLGLAERQSTDVLAIQDPEICDALRFIRMNANRPIEVGDVLRQVSLSRRVLERRFRELLQRTPAQEIRRTHIERAKLLLAQTNMSVPDVAAASGFNYVEHMIPLFKKMVGVTPLAFRRQRQST
jgi:LacI family transcriptional regulator